MIDQIFVSETAKREIQAILDYVKGVDYDLNVTSASMAIDLALAVKQGTCKDSLESAVIFLDSESYNLDYGE